MAIQTFKEKIRQRRSQMLVHSYIYYELGSSLVTDHKWQEWADELAKMQTKGKYPIIRWYDEEFRDWTGETGFHLPRDQWVSEKALYLIRIHDEYGEKDGS